MARIYEKHPMDMQVDAEGKQPLRMDATTKRALLKFWLSSLGLICAAMILYYFSRRLTLPGGALAGAVLTGIVALILLYIMNRALHRIRVVSPSEAKVDARTEHTLEQLDDRFALFNDVRAEEQPVDHLVVGPTGVFCVRVSDTTKPDGWNRSEDLETAREGAAALQRLLEQIAPEIHVGIEPVLCVPAGITERVGQNENGVWVVAAGKIAAALIMRSSQDGAITKNVNETGAFSSDTLQTAAVERAFANHWNLPTRKNQTDYMPPSNLTSAD